MQLRPYASTYVLRRIQHSTCLHIDITAYEISLNSYVIKYELRRGGKGSPVLELWFYVGADTWSGPVQLPATHPYVLDAQLTEPVLMTGRDRRAIAQAFTEYHHKYLRDIATQYPIEAQDCRTRSVVFHYFVKPDHDPAQGFANWYKG